AQAAKQRDQLDERPELGLAARLERAPTEHPSLDQIGMNRAGLPEREVALVDRAHAARAKAQLTGLGRAREQLEGGGRGLLVKRSIDAVVDQDRETNFAQGGAQLSRERAPIGRPAREPLREVAGANAKLLVEPLDFGGGGFGELVLLQLVDLLVVGEVA